MKIKNNAVFLTLLSFVLILSLTMVCASEDIAQDTVAIDSNVELSSGNTIYISPNGSGSGDSQSNPTNWNSAISKANSGDTIQFLDGNYTGIKGTVYTSVELKGSGNSIIDAEGNGGFFSTSSGTTVTLNQLSFINANTGKHESGPDSAKTGNDGEGGIVNDRGTLIVKNCYFENNMGWGTKGGSINNDGTCYVYDSIFKSNGGKKGGGIFIDEKSQLYVYNTKFENGLSKDGSAIYADKNAYVEIRNCTAINSYGKCSMIYIKKSTVYIYDSVFANSSAVDTAAVINIDKESYVAIDNCLFDNVAARGAKLWFHDNENGTGNGGAIVIEKDAKSVTITNSNFTNCKAKGDGGAIYVESQASCTIENCIFKDNTAGYGGSHIYSYGGSVNIKNSQLSAVVTIETSDISLGESEKIKITIDEGTNILNVNVNVLVDDNVSGTSSKSSTITLNDLKVGEYKVTLASEDKSNSNSYLYDVGSSSFSVSDAEPVDVTIFASDMARGYGSSADFKATFLNRYGKALANYDVIFQINEKNYTATTDSYGVATLSEKLAVGSYQITSINPRTGEMKTNALKIIDRIQNNKDLTMYYNDGSSFKLRVFADNGNAVGAGEIVSINVGKNTYNVKTNANGYAVLKIGFVPGTYKVTSTYKGVLKSNKIIVKSVIVAKNIKVSKKKTKTIKYKVTLKANNKAIKNKKLTATFKGKTYKAKTNSKGVATFKIKNSFKTGSYKIKVKYLNASVKKTIKIVK